MNVIGTLIWLPIIWLLVDITIWISPASPGLEGTARAAAEVPRQIANANTLFNVLNTLIFIGFTGWFAKLAERIVPERELQAGVIIEPEFLDEAALKAPSIALQQVRLELARKMLTELYGSVVEAVGYAVQAIRDNDQHAAESVLMMKNTLREQADRLLERKASRLSVDDPDHLERVRLEMSFVDQMRRIYTLSKRIAKVVLPREVAERD